MLVSSCDFVDEIEICLELLGLSSLAGVCAIGGMVEGAGQIEPVVLAGLNQPIRVLPQSAAQCWGNLAPFESWTIQEKPALRARRSVVSSARIVWRRAVARRIVPCLSGDANSDETHDECT